MATLIQSKQIQGIVTASVIEGDFVAQGSITGSSISASQVLGVKYDDIEGTPNFIGGTAVAQLNAYTASTDIRLDGLSSQTGSYLTSLPTNLVSGSDQLTSSYDQRYALSGSVGGGSTDISSINNYTSSTDSRLDIIESFTSSIEGRITTLENQTDNTGSDTQTLSIVGDQLTIDGGNTVTIPTGSGGSSTDISLLNTFTESIDSRVDNIEQTTSSLQSQIDSLVSATSSYSTGSHTSIENLNTFTSSIQTQVDSLTSQTSSYLTDLPNGLLSGSLLPGTNVTIDSSSGDYIISASIPGGGDTSYDGDRVVSNTLLGELYSQSFNAGTSGSVQDFLNAVFFPSAAPTADFTDQTANFNTNLATDGTNLVSVSITDTIDDSPYVLTLSGTDAASLVAVPTNADSSSYEIRANGDLSAQTYSYNVTVTDASNASRDYNGRSIAIQQADNGTLTPNGTFYIIESATNGNFIRTNSNGFSGGQGSVSVSYSPSYGSPVATNFQSSNPLIDINSSTRVLTVGNNISGSGNTNGDTITSTITFEDQYGNQGSGSITVNVTENTAPDIVFSNSSLLNTNQATGSSGTLVTISFSDTEGDLINHDTFTFTDPSGQLQSTKSGNNYLVTATSDLSGSTNYTITCSIEDIHGFSTNTETHTFTIATADDGTLGGDTSIYIVESATSGDSFRDTTGFGNGNLANISVSYSPNYGSQTPTLTSSNPAIVLDGSGNLTLGVDLSGSVTQSGDTFSSTISWTDQYGNTDSGTVTATVFGNQSPSATFTDNGLTDVTAISGSNIASISITDTETNTPFSASIGGTDGGKFNLVPQNSNSSSYQVQPTGSLDIGDYSVQIVIIDSYSEQSTLNETISVTSDSDFGEVYIYTSTRVGGGTLNSGNYLGTMGGSTVNGDTPPLVTTFTADSSSPFLNLVSGSIGDSTISVTGGTMTLRDTVSGSDMTVITTGSFDGSNGQEIFLLVFPSGSDMVGTPTSMTDSLGGSTDGEYVLYAKLAGESSFGVLPTQIHSLDLNTPLDGFEKWNVIGVTTPLTATSYEIRLVPSSGSAPS